LIPDNTLAEPHEEPEEPVTASREIKVKGALVSQHLLSRMQLAVSPEEDKSLVLFSMPIILSLRIWSNK
jgi:hypothetical protein